MDTKGQNRPIIACTSLVKEVNQAECDESIVDHRETIGGLDGDLSGTDTVRYRSSVGGMYQRKLVC